MTPRLKECLDFISGFWADNGYAPSFDEIKGGLNAKSKSSVAALVDKLEARGYITRIPNLARSIRVAVSPSDPPAAPQDIAPTPSEPEVERSDEDKDVPWA